MGSDRGLLRDCGHGAVSFLKRGPLQITLCSPQERRHSCLPSPGTHEESELWDGKMLAQSPHQRTGDTPEPVRQYFHVSCQATKPCLQGRLNPEKSSLVLPIPHLTTGLSVACPVSIPVPGRTQHLCPVSKSGIRDTGLLAQSAQRNGPPSGNGQRDSQEEEWARTAMEGACTGGNAYQTFPSAASLPLRHEDPPP